MKHSDIYWMAKQASKIDTALEAASWVPGFVGAGAGAIKGVRNLAQGNILKGVGDLAMGGAQLFGGGTVIKGIGKGLQYGSKLLGGTRMGAKAIGAVKGLGSAAMKSAPTMAGGIQRGAKAVGSAAYNTMVPEATQFGQKMVGSGLGGMMANNTGKLTLGGMGASMAGDMRQAGQAATKAEDAGVLSNMQSMTSAARNYNPSATGQYNPSQAFQQPGMMGPGAPMWG